MSDTPRTDVIKIRCGFQAVPEPILKHARKLERENAALREALKRADLALDDLGIGRAAPVRTIARNALRKEAQP